MSPSAFRWTSRLAVVGLVAIAMGLGGCKAGIEAPTSTGGTGGSGSGKGGTIGTGGAVGTGGEQTTGTGGSGVPLPVPPGCGDGINNQGGIEQCDDGNTTAGDGCYGACQVEPDWTCPPAGACKRSFKCGDGVIDPGEVCDDGNTTDGDGCNATCTVQDGRLHLRCRASPACCSSICGDGASSRARAATTATRRRRRLQLRLPGRVGWVCPAPGSPCTTAPRCGDGIVQVVQGEVCDDGNITDGDGCSSTCKVEGAGCTCAGHEVLMPDGDLRRRHRSRATRSATTATSTAATAARRPAQSRRATPARWSRRPASRDCGDGILDRQRAVRRRQHRRTKSGCSANCRWNRRLDLHRQPGHGVPPDACGDGMKDGAEGCDDGNTTPSTAARRPASGRAAVPAGAAASAPASAATASSARASSATTATPSGDGCSSTCTLESGFIVHRSRRSATASRCRSSTATSAPHAERLRAGRDRQSDGDHPGPRQAMLDADWQARLLGRRQHSFITSAATFAAVVHGRRRHQQTYRRT